MQNPFVHLVRDLCASEGLVDIAPRGRASQSSTSRWSQPDDAQRAVMGVDKDFAFHTDTEDAPWWRLDFEASQHPDYIVISNRRRAEFQTQASTLRVEVSEDGNTWHLLHAGRLIFGAEGQGGVPLILPLMTQVPLRHLRLSLADRNPLHLSAVRVLARHLITPPAPKAITFAANRTDGFGERLKAIVNAFVLAKRFDGNVVVSWDGMTGAIASDHAIGAARDIFSPAFISAHIRPVQDGVPLSRFMRDKARPPAGGGPVIVSQGSLRNSYPDLMRDLTGADLSDAFGKIGFSDHMRRAIDAARAMDIPKDSVGIHLRAGDIVYGRYRFNSRYGNKVVPYPICMAFIEAERRNAHAVLIFGQDADLCRQIAGITGATFVSDARAAHDFDPRQAAIFDIVAMSRCARVVAGKSGFSQTAQVLGRFDTIDPSAVLPAQTAATIMRTAVLGQGGHPSLTPSPLQQAFTAWYTYHVYRKFLSEADRIALLRAALAADPVNVFYGIVLALEMFAAGDVAESHAQLDLYMDRAFPAEAYGSLRDIVGTRHPDGSLALTDYEDRLLSMARSGSRTAGVLVAAMAHKRQDSTAFETLSGALDASGKAALRAMM